MTEQIVRIAYLVLCHRDPAHIARLAIKLASDDELCAVFIHVDGKSDIAEALADLVQGRERILLVEPRVPVYWAGYSGVEASYLLLRASYRHGIFDRFVILQGADYPIKSPRAIRAMFARQPTREFIRACDTTIARTKYLYSKSRHIVLKDRPHIAKKVWNKLSRILDLRVRSGSMTVDGRIWHIYWGAAHIAFTRPMADLFLAYENHPVLERRFRTSFAPEESYFHTIAFNSAFRGNTSDGVPVAETPTIRLVDTRSIAYFEYPRLVTVWTEADFARLSQVEEPFIRKVSTDVSTGLLDRIDAMHTANAEN